MENIPTIERHRHRCNNCNTFCIQDDDDSTICPSCHERWTTNEEMEGEVTDVLHAIESFQNGRTYIETALTKEEEQGLIREEHHTGLSDGVACSHCCWRGFVHSGTTTCPRCRKEHVLDFQHKEAPQAYACLISYRIPKDLPAPPVPAIQEITKDMAEDLIRGITSLLVINKTTDSIRPYFDACLNEPRVCICCTLHHWEDYPDTPWVLSNWFERLDGSEGRTLRIRLFLKFPYEGQYERCTLFAEIASLFVRMGLVLNKLVFESHQEFPGLCVKIDQTLKIRS